MKAFAIVLLSFFRLTTLLLAQPRLPEPNPVFDDAGVSRVEILIDADSLAALLAPENAQSDHEYLATFIFTGAGVQDTVERAGFRLRGNTSREAAKKSFKVSFNTFERGRKYRGLEKLNLNGEHNDPSIIRAKLCWDIFRSMEVPTSRANHVTLFINGVYFGLYINVEHIDEVFVRTRFGNNDGNLYKCLWPADLAYLGDDPDLYKAEFFGRRAYDLKTNKAKEDYSDLAHFVSVLNLTPDSTFAREIQRVFNVDSFLRALAVDVAVGSWDDYWFLKNNYYLYHNTETGLFEFIPFDYDNTFGIWWDDILRGIDWGTRNIYNWGHPFERRPLVTRILAVPEFRNRFSFYLNRLLQTAFDPQSFFPKIDALHNLITPAAESDTFRTQDYGFTITDFHNSYLQSLGGHVKYGLKPYITIRRSSALGQLELHDIAPIIRWTRHTPAAPRPGDAVTITARVLDDSPGIIVQVHYREDGVWHPPLDMLDDGAHADSLPGDGIYGAQFLPATGVTTVHYYISAIDASSLQSAAPAGAPDALFEIRLAPALPVLLINEFMAANDSTIADAFGEYDDWFEIFNAESVPVWLGDKFATDDFGVPDKWALPDTTLDPGEILLIWADGQPEQGPLHADFRLSRNGEQLGLYVATETGLVPLDTLSFGPQQTDVSYGRSPDGDEAWQFFSTPTPGARNTVTGLHGNRSGPPAMLWLEQNYPNPFNPATTIGFTLPQQRHVRLAIYNAAGQLVRTLRASKLPAGEHTAIWDGRNSAGHAAATGAYYAVLELDGVRRAVKKMMLVR